MIDISNDAGQLIFPHSQANFVHVQEYHIIVDDYIANIVGDINDGRGKLRIQSFACEPDFDMFIPSYDICICSYKN